MIFQLQVFTVPWIHALRHVTSQCLSHEKCTRGLFPCIFVCPSLCFLDFWLGHTTYFGPWEDSRCHANKGLKCACTVSESTVGCAPWHFCPHIEKNFSQGGCCLFHLELRTRHVEQTVEPAGFRTGSGTVQPSPAQPRSANSQLADHRWVK